MSTSRIHLTKVIRCGKQSIKKGVWGTYLAHHDPMNLARRDCVALHNGVGPLHYVDAKGGAVLDGVPIDHSFATPSEEDAEVAVVYPVLADDHVCTVVLCSCCVANYQSLCFANISKKKDKSL